MYKSFIVKRACVCAREKGVRTTLDSNWGSFLSVRKKGRKKYVKDFSHLKNLVVKHIGEQKIPTKYHPDKVVLGMSR